MNANQIKSAYESGSLPHEILNQLVETGFDVDYAALRISQVLGMKKNEVSKMKETHNN